MVDYTTQLTPAIPDKQFKIIERTDIHPLCYNLFCTTIHSTKNTFNRRTDSTNGFEQGLVSANISDTHKNFSKLHKSP